MQMMTNPSRTIICSSLDILFCWNIFEDPNKHKLAVEHAFVGVNIEARKSKPLQVILVGKLAGLSQHSAQQKVNKSSFPHNESACNKRA